MWTPKRIVLLSLCFIGVSALYLGYAYSAIGSIDGLPPLPEIYWQGKDGEPPTNPAATKSLLAASIRMAFGDPCPEMDYPIKLALPAKNMVLTASNFTVEPDGRVCLTSVSLATFKERKDGSHPDVTTMRAEVAWITFDRPISTFSEIAYRKIVEAELLSLGKPDKPGKVEVVNNRGRKERDQDLILHVDKGPIYYREDTHQIWTNAPVHVYDHRSKPKPHTVDGKGMRMELLTETPPAPGARQPARKQQRDSITGVKWITLQSAVKMVIQLDGNNGFLAGGQPPPKEPAKQPEPAAKPRDRSELTITTPGSFRYDVNKDHDVARFDESTVGGQTPNAPPQVKVVRMNLTDRKSDKLDCQHLTLRLRRKDSSPDAKNQKKPDGGGENVEVETAEATASGPGKFVTMTSDSDGLIVNDANYFFHDTLKQKTLIRSNNGPVKVTYKVDTKIESRDLEIQDVKPPVPPGWKAGVPLPASAKPYQKVWARGPGWITMVDKPEKGEKRNVKAEWSELLTSDRDGAQDVLTLTGNAKFIDLEAEQNLKADMLKVWLDAPEEVKSQPADKGITNSRKPREVLAVGNVVARSKEMNIHDTGKLIVKFIDVPASKHLPPGAAPPKEDKRPATVTTPAKTEEVKPREPKEPAGPQKAVVTAQPAGSAGSAGPELAPAQTEAPPRPFDLSARLVEARVERSPVKSSIDELWCEGQVKIRQEPDTAKGETKGTDVNGEKLKMTALPEGGYHLTVLGGEGENDLAELATDKIYIIGPEININQGTNKAWVVGEGAMRMESLTNFQGEKLKEPVPMTVHWDRSMLFNGTTAEFVGNIQATQQTGRLAGQHLLVTFDRVILLKKAVEPEAQTKEGAKPEQPARVKKMVCDQDVRIEDLTRDPKYPNDASKVIRYVLLRAPVTHVESLESMDDKADPKAAQKNRMIASGPGTFRVWEPGKSSDLEMKGPEAKEPKKPAPKKSDKPDKPEEPEMKMTLVSFRRQMQANNQTNTAKFWENVRVLSLPWPKYDKPLDMDKTLMSPLPEGALYLRCEHLQVLDTPEIVEKGEVKRPANKEMEGHVNVYVQGREFYAHARSVFYNQQKQQVILVGTKESPTTMVRQKGNGQPETVTAQKITYNRSTGETIVFGADQVQGQTAPGGGRPAPAGARTTPGGERPAPGGGRTAPGGERK